MTSLGHQATMSWDLFAGKVFLCFIHELTLLWNNIFYASVKKNMCHTVKKICQCQWRTLKDMGKTNHYLTTTDGQPRLYFLGCAEVYCYGNYFDKMVFTGEKLSKWELLVQPVIKNHNRWKLLNFLFSIIKLILFLLRHQFGVVLSNVGVSGLFCTH